MVLPHIKKYTRTFSHTYIDEQEEAQNAEHKSKHSMLSQILLRGKVDRNKKQGIKTSW